MSCPMCGCTFQNSCCSIEHGVCSETSTEVCSFCVEGIKTPKLLEWKATHKDRIEKNLYTRYSDKELKFIEENYAVLSRAEISWVLGRSSHAVKSLIDKRLQVRKTKDQVRALVSRVPNSGRFKPGNAPINDLGSPGVVTVRFESNEQNTPYQYLKLESGKWELLHRYMWELKNGAIPAKHIATFKDGNSMHCTIENLELISMADNARRNAGHKSLCDNYIAGQLAKEGRAVNLEKKKDLLEYPELLETKRTQILLNRELKNTQNGKTNTTRKA